MKHFDIHENVVSTDYIEKTDSGRYVLTYYTYATCWTDNEHKIKGNTLREVLDEYENATHRLRDVQEVDDEGYATITEELAEMIDWED